MDPEIENRFKNFDTSNQVQIGFSESEKENIKFFVFCTIVDTLFETFSAKVSLANAEEFSGTLLGWFETHCNQQSLRESFVSSLQILGGKCLSEVYFIIYCFSSKMYCCVFVFILFLMFITNLNALF